VEQNPVIQKTTLMLENISAYMILVKQLSRISNQSKYFLCSCIRVPA